MKENQNMKICQNCNTNNNQHDMKNSCSNYGSPIMKNTEITMEFFVDEIKIDEILETLEYNKKPPFYPKERPARHMAK